MKYTAPKIENRSTVKGLMFWDKQPGGKDGGGYR